ncbi:MAG: hypothetical protein Q8O99_07420 [bacterium]|nr:hypothetical protein [bacterium]
MLDPLLSERIKQSSLRFEHEVTAGSLIQAIRARQNPAGGVLFVLGVNYDILYGQTSLSQDGGGHIVVSTGINEQDQFIIYEPIRPRPNPHLIATQKVMDAMADL